MRRILPGLLACFILLGLPSIVAGPREAEAPAGPVEEGFLREGVPAELAGRIDAAVEKGLARVEATLERTYGWIADAGPDHSMFDSYSGGIVGIQVLTLAKCGDERHREAVERGIAWLREHHGRQEQFKKTYSVAINILAIEAYLRKFGGGRSTRENQPDLEWAARLAFWLASGSGDGGWSYSCPGYEAQGEYGTGGEAPSGGRRGGGSPFGGGQRGGRRGGRGGDASGEEIRFRTPPPIPRLRETVSGSYDHSNTQYAVLGLKAATHLGIEFPPSLWEEMAEHWLATQEEEGPAVDLRVDRETEVSGTLEGGLGNVRARSWQYADRNSRPSLSMTVGGLAAMVLLGSEIEDARLRSRVEEAHWDGWAWMQENYRIDFGGGYYLYGLERAGVFSQIRTIGEHDWYVEGAEHLVGAQNADGTWGQVEGDVDANPFQANSMSSAIWPVETCFALLFLKRASSGYVEDYSVGPGR